jgi:radical SAM superfamily enzyme YgiQ (UPF0313 family)
MAASGPSVQSEPGEGQIRVLVIWPPHVPSYFNAGHRLPIFQVAAYLRRSSCVSGVECVDAGALNMSWKEVGDLLFQGRFDLIAVANEYDAIEGVDRLVRYTRALAPKARLVTFGRLSHQIPRFFERYGFDAIVESGDYEAGVGEVVRALVHRSENVPGVAIRTGEAWVRPARPGRFLDPADWALPEIDEIPYSAYDRMYRRDENKFCGLPGRRELVVPVARGCPVACEFCDVPLREGYRERRLPVAAVLRYIEDSFAAASFEYVSMYAPTFTLNRPWVDALCRGFIERGARYMWKCTTTIHHLDQPLVELMAQSGCVRISVGLETLEPEAQQHLPQLKHIERSRFEAVSTWCRQTGIELNCFIMVGMPGASLEGTKETVDMVHAQGARLRPTVYTPFSQLDADGDEGSVSAYNRQLLDAAVPAEEAAELYRIVFGPEPKAARVVDSVP